MPAGTGHRRQVAVSLINVQPHHVMPNLVVGPLGVSSGLKGTRL